MDEQNDNATLAILGEQMMSLPELARESSRAASTVWRWTKYGVAGVRLEAVCVGGRRVTSRQAYHRFIKASTRAAEHSSTSKNAVEATEKDAVMKELSALGV